MPKPFQILVLCLVAGGFLDAQAQLVQEAASGSQFLRYDLTSPSVADNQMGASGAANLFVVLPETYRTSETRYPVVYFLHGFGETPQQVRDWRSRLNAAFAGRKAFILVGVDGRTKDGGGFYVNSAKAGRWEDWLVKEVVPFIDSKLRTLARAESRGLFGFSMGGFGALSAGLRHPETFAAAFALSPGVFHPIDGLEEALKTWRPIPVFLTAYSAAFGGDAAHPDQWKAGFGDWNAKLDAALALPVRLKAVALEWGAGDEYPWIPRGSRWLAGYLAERGFSVEAREFAGGHEIPVGRIQTSVAPFFQQSLVFE